MVQMLKKQYELLSFNGPPKIIKYQISSTKSQINSKFQYSMTKTFQKANRRTAEYRISNVEGWNRCALSFFKIDRIHSFDIRYSVFDIRHSLLIFSLFPF